MTHYDEFGLSPTASVEEIQHAHRNLARLLHPDPIQDEELRRLAECQLKRLNHVYSILNDPTRRRCYDQQLAHEVVQHHPPLRGGDTWQTRGWIAVFCLMAGFQAAVWWSAPQRLAGQPAVSIKRDNSPPPPGPAAAQPPPAATRELQRIPHQASLERDRAMARRAATDAPTHAESAATAAAGPAREPAYPDQPRSGANNFARPLPGLPAQPAAGSPASLAGTWIYSAPGNRGAAPDQYAAEYIELLIAERDNYLRGRYRGRYKVPDRAMSPEVEFYFEGPVGGERHFAWRGNGGAEGLIDLKPLSNAALSLDWYTSQYGRGPTLGSGTAVLVRRQE